MSETQKLQRGAQFKDRLGRTWQLHKEGHVRGGWECFEVLSNKFDDGIGRYVQRLGATPTWFSDADIQKGIAA